jgi:biopolymer transport protein ExbB/TolQ
MQRIDRLTRFLQDQRCRRLIIQDDQECILYREDGTIGRTKDSISAAQVRELLDEILPVERADALDRGEPIQFRRPHPRGNLGVEAVRTDGRTRISIDLQPEDPAPPEGKKTPEPTMQQVEPGSEPVKPAGQAAAVPEDRRAEVGALSAGHQEKAPEADRSGEKRVDIALGAQMPPAILRREPQFRFLAAIGGIILGLGTSVAIGFGLTGNAMLAKMFDPRNPSTAIPVAISCVFFWGAFLCTIRWFHIRALQRCSSGMLLEESIRTLASAGPSALSENLRGPMVSFSPLLRRMEAAVRQWLISPGLQDADIALQQHVVRDDEHVHAAYGLLRTFVWALPVLGLIGTVIGISQAVGGFANFLGGNIDDVTQIKKNLVDVTGGLSFAFLITLQGLLASLLLMLITSSLQTREGRFFLAMGQDIGDRFLPALQKSSPKAEDGEISIWRESVRSAASQVVDLVRKEYETGGSRLAEAVDRAGKALERASEEFARNNSSLVRSLEEQARAVAQPRPEVTGAIAELTGAVRSNLNALEGLSQATRSIQEHQMALQSTIREISGSSLEQTFSSFAAALSGQTREIGNAAQTVAALSTMTRDVVAAQASLQTAVAQLKETEFSGTLTSFKDALLDLIPVLSAFREPFVIRAIPFSGKDGNGGHKALREEVIRPSVTVES